MQCHYFYYYHHHQRHDGTEIASADEFKLLQDGDSTEDTAEQLQPIGIRRWRLQKVLFQAVQDAGINVHFNKRLQSLAQEQVSEGPRVRLTFQDGTVRTTQLLIGCDGSKSQVRSIVSHGKYKLQHTGTTCLMGTSTVPSQVRGISLPSSDTTKCHGAFYPTGRNEQCFQFHFPTIVDGKEMETDQHHPVDPKDVSWGGLTHAVEQEECNKLADRLIQDGWDEKFIKPLRQVDKALKIGFATLEPHLKSYICGHNNIVLVGDSAHPPVPYLGQGAQQGLEDAGTLALLLKQYCVRQQVPGTSSAPEFSLARVDPALQLYDKLRLPRTAEVLKRGKLWGKQQQKRAENKRYNQMREENILRDVFYHETLPVLLPVVQHDYREEVLAAIAESDAKKHEAKGAARLVQPATSGNGSSNGGSVETAPEHHPLVSVPEETVCY